MKRIARAEPLICVRRAVLVLLASALITSALGRVVFMLNSDARPCWNDIVLGAYFAGHTLLALLLTWRRLHVRFPVGLAWLDLLVIVGAPWLGPAFWYCEWRRARQGLGEASDDVL